MTDTEIRAAIAAERTDLADALDRLTPARWDAPTLCDGWRVRELVAHVTMPYRTSIPRIMLEMFKARGNINRMLDRTARQAAASSTPAELAASLRGGAHHPWKPPGGSYTDALFHEVVHGLDWTEPLGLDRRVPMDRLRPLMGGITPKGLKFFGTDLSGVELRADDMDWTYGSGAPLHGSAQDLLLVCVGRRVPVGRLRGESSGRFARGVLGG